MTSQLQSPWLTFYDSDGEPLVGAKIRIYEPGTLTPLDAFDDEGATVSDAVSQPFVTNAAGRIPRYFVTQKYRMTVHTSADVLVDDVDDQDPGLPSGFGVSATVQIAQGGTGATNAAAARANLDVPSGATVTALQDTVTEHETFIDSARNVGVPTRAGLLAPEDEVTTDLLVSGFGVIVKQRLKDTTAAASTTTVNTPAYDTSIPQIGEGTEIFSQAITPTSSSSTIRIRLFLDMESSAANGAAHAAIFKNSDANALAAAASQHFGSGANALQVYLEYEESAASTAARTYSARVGTSAGTLRINGSGGTGTFGGVRVSFLEVSEELTV